MSEAKDMKAKTSETEHDENTDEGKDTEQDMIVVVIQHSSNVPLAYLGDFLTKKSATTTIIKLFDGDTLPSLQQLQPKYVKAIISLGGIMGAYDEKEYPWLKLEKQWLREHVDQKTPILGICLGCQILADALGGKAYPAAKFEVGYPKMELTSEGKSDPVMGNFTDPVLVHHGDTWDLPPNGTLLASTIYPQAFRFGSAFGVQFHPEATPKELEGWAKASTKRYESIKANPAAVIKESQRLEKETKKASEIFFESWWKSLSS